MNYTEKRRKHLYVGVVKDVIKGMQTAFVDIGTEKIVYTFKRPITKVDETKEKLDEIMIQKVM